MCGGIVKKGKKVGRQFGYPTANLDIPKNKFRLSPGVYAAWVDLNNKKYQAAMAVQETPWSVEVYLLGYKGKDFYGAYLEVDPIEKVGSMCRFSDPKELKEKIKEDIKKVKRVFKS